jgi:hypothetical protein
VPLDSPEEDDDSDPVSMIDWVTDKVRRGTHPSPVLGFYHLKGPVYAIVLSEPVPNPEVFVGSSMYGES